MQEHVIAIDYDDTMVENGFPNVGVLKPNCKRVIEKLKENGHKIIIWTCRSDDWQSDKLYEMIHYLDEQGIPYDAINKNIEPSRDFNPYPKVYYTLIIDDKCLFIPKPISWYQIESQLKKVGII